MTETLWPHQTAGIRWIEDHRAAYLAWKMRTGKTRTTIEAVRSVGAQRVLVVAPKSVVPVWQAEFDRWWPDHPFAIVGRTKASIRQDVERILAPLGLKAEPMVCVVNLDAYWREPLKSWALAQPWDAVVYDEAHRLKAPGGKASMFATLLRSRLEKRGARRIALSGTPQPHSPLDLYAQYRALDNSILGNSYTAFRARYAELEPNYAARHHGSRSAVNVVGWRNLDELQEKIATITHEASIDDLMKLPPVIDQYTPIEMSAKAQRVYRELEREMIAQIEDGTVTVNNVLAKAIRLHQIVQGFIVVESGEHIALCTARFDAMVDWMEDQPTAEPLVVFCAFHHDLDQVKRAAQKVGRAHEELSGRENNVGAVWTPAAPGAVLAVQIKAGSMGIDLTAATQALWFAHHWNWGDIEQIRARMHGPKARGAIAYTHLVVNDSIERQMLGVLEKRGDMAKELIQSLRAATRAR